MKPKLVRPPSGTSRKLTDNECEILGLTRDRSSVATDAHGKVSFTRSWGAGPPLPTIVNALALQELERWWDKAAPKRKLPTGMERHPWKRIVATIPARIGLGSVDILECGHTITAHAGPKPETRQCKRCPKELANARSST